MRIKIKIDNYSNEEKIKINIIFSSLSMINKIEKNDQIYKNEKNYFIKNDGTFSIDEKIFENNIKAFNIFINGEEDIDKMEIANLNKEDTIINFDVNEVKIFQYLKLLRVYNLTHAILLVDFFKLSHHSDKCKFNLEIVNKTLSDVIVKNVLMKNRTNMINNGMGNLILENVCVYYLKLNNNSVGNVLMIKSVINETLIFNNSNGSIKIEDSLFNNCLLKNQSFGKIEYLKSNTFSLFEVENDLSGIVYY